MAKTTSKYKEKFCADLITHMTAGADFRSFAGKCSVSRNTLYEWLKRHPEFQAAYDIAIEKAYAFWEEMARRYLIVRKDEDRVDTGMFVLNMRNRFQWLSKDKEQDENDPKKEDAFSENYMTWEKRKSDR